MAESSPVLRDKQPEKPLPLGQLTRRAEFLAVAATKRKWASASLVLQVRRHDARQQPAPGEPLIRVGFTASRRVGNAVARNRARRRLRAAVRAVLPFCAATGYDVVVIARSETLTCPFAGLKDDLMAGLKRLQVWRKGETPAT